MGFRIRRIAAFLFGTILCISCGGGSSSSGSSSTGGGGNPGVTNPAPMHSFLYVSETTMDTSANMHGVLEAFSIDSQTGAFSAVPGSPFATNFSTGGDLALSPNNSQAYVLAQNFGSGCCVGPTSLQVYSLDTNTGVPTQSQSLAGGGAYAFSLAVHPSGSFLYVSPWNNDNTGIGLYSVGNNGTVTFMNVQSAQTQDNVAITPDGKYLYTHTDGAPVGGPISGACGPIITNLWAYSIDASTGALTQVAGSPFTFQRQECVVGHSSPNLLKQVDASGSRMLIVDEANRLLDVFTIDDATGALSQGMLNIPSGFSSLVMDPHGKFLYVGDVLEFFGYSLSGSSTPPALPGMPEPLAPQPANNETGSTTMAIDTTSSYLFSNENGYTSAFSCCGPDGLVEFQITSNGSISLLTTKWAMLAGSATKMVTTR